MSSRPVSFVRGEDDINSTTGQPQETSELAQVESEASQSNQNAIGRSMSTSSTKIPDGITASKGGTLKKKGSLRKRDSLRRSNSKRSVTAGSIKGTMEDDEEYNSVYHTPVPTSGNPTDVLANRFQVWRNLLKDLITYFREIQSSYEQRSKSLLKISNVINNTRAPTLFRTTGGLDDATHVLRNFHKQSTTEANKSRDIENDVITQLSGLRNDLGQKIKEIKSLSGDFKNTVDREKDGSRKAVSSLQDALNMSERDPSSASGKGDPFIVRMAVHRHVEKQIEEENYLHRAYLNLEGSGRELEQIVVGEIQKAYNAYAGILKREVDSASETVESLRAGPIAMPKDHEWTHFAENDPHFVNPNLPLRKVDHITYPGKLDPAASEIRAGMLERKSKYLKSYTPGWYVLSATHLHEFKSADHIHTQTPIMSLPLHDQRLGSHSDTSSSSHKFSLKGRQSGGMHRGHSWVFRAESYDTMVAWYEDIKSLTEKTGAEKATFIRQHARSLSGGSHPGAAPSVSSDGVEDDEADEVPYSAHQTADEGADPAAAAVLEPPPKRPEPGGRFPSDLNVNREGLHRVSSSSGSGGPDVVDPAAAVVIPVRQQHHDGSKSQPEEVLAASALSASEPRHPHESGHVVSARDASPNPNANLPTGTTATEPMFVSSAAPIPTSSSTVQPSELHDNPISPPPQLATNDDLFAAGALGGLANTGSPPQTADDRGSISTGMTSPPGSAAGTGLGLDGAQMRPVQTSDVHVPGEFP
ncbi:MAG: hypothetical protein M1828_000173 [Chrysothrix sp. TS-e1954]|nr:MAG: hypothetical protein M1828_000173 [Chrysothrix sp. TS-e1954]